MGLGIHKCVVCSSSFKPAATGRPRLYCSNACRLAAQRRRRIGRATSAPSQATEETVADTEDFARLVFALPVDPDEAVAKVVLEARSLGACFGFLGRTARPEFSWRCEKMADHVADGLKKYFRP